MADRPTLTLLAPAGLSAGLKDAGFRGPYAADRSARGLVVDRDDHAVVTICPMPQAPALRGMLADLLASVLNGLEAEQKSIAAPLDPPHVAAVEQQSRERNAVSGFNRRLGEQAVQRRRDAGE